LTKDGLAGRFRHMAYAGGWKKFEPMWDWVIRAKRVASLRPALEAILGGLDRRGLTPTALAAQTLKTVRP